MCCLVGEDGDREGGVVASADSVLEGDPVQRPADGRLEVGERPRDEGHAGGVGAGAREGVAVVAADRHRATRDAGRLGREAPLSRAPALPEEPTASPRRGRRGRRRRTAPAPTTTTRSEVEARACAGRGAARATSIGSPSSSTASTQPRSASSAPGSRRDAGGSALRVDAREGRGRRIRTRSRRGSRTGARTGSRPGAGRRTARSRRTRGLRRGRQTACSPARICSPGQGREGTRPPGCHGPRRGAADRSRGSDRNRPAGDQAPGSDTSGAAAAPDLLVRDDPRARARVGLEIREAAEQALLAGVPGAAGLGARRRRRVARADDAGALEPPLIARDSHQRRRSRRRPWRS